MKITPKFAEKHINFANFIMNNKEMTFNILIQNITNKSLIGNILTDVSEELMTRKSSVLGALLSTEDGKKYINTMPSEVFECIFSKEYLNKALGFFTIEEQIEFRNSVFPKNSNETPKFEEIVEESKDINENIISRTFDDEKKLAQTLLTSKNPINALLELSDEDRNRVNKKDKSTVLKALLFFSDEQLKKEELECTFSGPVLLTQLPSEQIRSLFKEVLNPDLYSIEDIRLLVQHSFIDLVNLNPEQIVQLTTSKAPTPCFNLNEVSQHPFDKDKIIVKAGLQILKGKSSQQEHFIFILDNSSSMQVDKLDIAKKALASLAEKISKNATLSLISFNSSATLELTNGNLDEFLDKLKKINTTGGTNFSSFFEKLKEIEKFITSSRTTKVLLLTDGQNNEGSKVSKILQTLEDKWKHINFNVIGIGNDYDENQILELNRYFFKPHRYAKTTNDVKETIMVMSEEGFLDQTMSLMVEFNATQNESLSKKETFKNILLNKEVFNLIELPYDSNQEVIHITGTAFAYDGFINLKGSSFITPHLTIKKSDLGFNTELINSYLIKLASDIYCSKETDSVKVKQSEQLLEKFGHFIITIETEEFRLKLEPFYNILNKNIETLQNSNNVEERKTVSSTNSFESFDVNKILNKSPNLSSNLNKTNTKSLSFAAFHKEQLEKKNNSESIIQKPNVITVPSELKTQTHCKKFRLYHENARNPSDIQLVFIGKKLSTSLNNVEQITFDPNSGGFLPNQKELECFIEQHPFIPFIHINIDGNKQSDVEKKIEKAFNWLVTRCGENPKKQFILFDAIPQNLLQSEIKSNESQFLFAGEQLDKIKKERNNLIWISSIHNIHVPTISAKHLMNVLLNLYLRGCYTKDVSVPKLLTWFNRNRETFNLESLNYSNIESDYFKACDNHPITLAVHSDKKELSELSFDFSLNIEYKELYYLYGDSGNYPTSIRIEFDLFDLKIYNKFEKSIIEFRKNKEVLASIQGNIFKDHEDKNKPFELNVTITESGAVIKTKSKIYDLQVYDQNNNKPKSVINLGQLSKIVLKKSNQETFFENITPIKNTYRKAQFLLTKNQLPISSSLLTEEHVDKFSLFCKNSTSFDKMLIIIIGNKCTKQLKNMKIISIKNGGYTSFNDVKLGGFLAEHKELEQFYEQHQNIRFINLDVDGENKLDVTNNLEAAFKYLSTLCEKNPTKNFLLFDQITPRSNEEFSETFSLQNVIDDTLLKINNNSKNLLWISSVHNKYLPIVPAEKLMDVLLNLHLHGSYNDKKSVQSLIKWFDDNKISLNLENLNYSDIESNFFKEKEITLPIQTDDELDNKKDLKELRFKFALNLDYEKVTKKLYKNNEDIYPTSIRVEINDFDIKIYNDNNESSSTIQFRMSGDGKKKVLSEIKVFVYKEHHDKNQPFPFEITLTENGPIIKTDSKVYDLRVEKNESNKGIIDLNKIKEIRLKKTDVPTYFEIIEPVKKTFEEKKQELIMEVKNEKKSSDFESNLVKKENNKAKETGFCGEKQLDLLREKGEIIKIETYSNNSVYGDDQCKISLKNGVVLFSKFNSFSNYFIISTKNGVFEKDFGGVNTLLTKLSMFEKNNKNENIKSCSFFKGPATEYYQNEKKPISEKEFDEVFDSLPEAIKNYLLKRHDEKNKMQKKQIITNENNVNGFNL